MDAERYQTFLRDLAEIEKFQDFVKQNYEYAKDPEEIDSQSRFNPLVHLDDKEFMKKYRLSKESMQQVITLIADDLDNPDFYQNRNVDEQGTHKPQVPVDIQIMAAIRFWGRTEHPLMTAYIHEVSTRTLHRICRRVAGALASKASFHIRMPATLSEKEAATNAFHFAKMPNVIGAIEYSSVAFKKQVDPQKLKPIAENIKEEQIHIQLISDAFCKIRDIDCKLRTIGDMSGSDVNETFSQSRIKERFEQNEFRGRILLGGERLASKTYPYLLTPIELPMTTKETAYNRSHSATLAVAEECLNLWKKRFCILESEICSTFHTAKNTIVALAVLHNLAIDWNDQALDRCTQTNVKATGSSHLSVGKCSDVDSRTEFIKNHF